jgi:single-strand DNA-binding protein
MYTNCATVVGNLTSDPRMGESENKVVNFRMGVNRRRRHEPEEADVERTEFVDVECWGSQAENVFSSLRRGDRVIVSGQLKYDQWNDAEGNFRSRLSIKASAVGASLEFRHLDAVPAGVAGAGESE